MTTELLPALSRGGSCSMADGCFYTEDVDSIQKIFTQEPVLWTPFSFKNSLTFAVKEKFFFSLSLFVTDIRLPVFSYLKRTGFIDI